jgi:hypothetical protein
MASIDPEIEVADAAHGSSIEAVEAIEEAARVNEDPVVAEALDEASLRASTTVGRLDWLRSRLRRHFTR